MDMTLNTQLCIIGGGMAGISAAVSAARRNVKVVLIHDRPVLGGNASSEIRMWIRGASHLFPYYREGGILEEIAMDNIYYNPYMDYPLWDAVLYQIVKSEPNITLLMNATCMDAVSKDGKIVCVKAWQLTTYKTITVYADYFADCSGDSILAKFTGAQIMTGRESKDQFNEKNGRPVADHQTMGISCLIQARETDEEIRYIPPKFAQKFSKDDFPYRMRTEKGSDFTRDNFWWIELGGEEGCQGDAERIKDRLLSAAYGVWDFVKNSDIYESQKWDLDFVGYLPAKRESFRYVGDYILTENDIDNSVEFEDEIAYGGWHMDDHNPLGMATREEPNKYHKVAKPYSIPYRCLYSKNIENLFFAGRNISVTHMALSSTRVMATCALLGQAVGTACSVAVKYGLTPRGVLGKIEELKQTLRDDDCYLLHTRRKSSPLLLGSNHNLSAENFAGITCGIERKLEENRDFCAEFDLGEEITFEFEPALVERLRLVFDNDIARESYPPAMFNEKMYPNRCHVRKNRSKVFIPKTLVKSYTVKVKVGEEWKELYSTEENRHRLNYVEIGREISGIKLIPRESYGCEKARIYSIDVL